MATKDKTITLYNKGTNPFAINVKTETGTTIKTLEPHCSMTIPVQAAKLLMEGYPTALVDASKMIADQDDNLEKDAELTKLRALVTKLETVENEGLEKVVKLQKEFDSLQENASREIAELTEKNKSLEDASKKTDK